MEVFMLVGWENRCLSVPIQIYENREDAEERMAWSRRHGGYDGYKIEAWTVVPHNKDNGSGI
jgi:hypothetical protein